jgi:hypothetical protein
MSYIKPARLSPPSAVETVECTLPLLGLRSGRKGGVLKPQSPYIARATVRPGGRRQPRRGVPSLGRWSNWIRLRCPREPTRIGGSAAIYSGIHRIESGDRRVDVDDLVAIAVALGVSPLALLLPTEAGAVLPGGESYTAEQIWDWGTGRAPLNATDDPIEFLRHSDPVNWPEIEAGVVRQFREANPNVQGAVASNFSRNKARRERRLKIAEQADHGDD